MRRRIATATALLVPAALALTACASSVDPLLTITDWLDDRGVACKESGGYDATTVSAVPFTRVVCDGVQVDFFEAGAADRYDAFWAADCAATPADQRAGLDDVSVVRGPTWVLRGDASSGGAWPESLVGSAGVTPQVAADDLGGRVSTLAQVCRDLGSWSS